MKRVLVVAPHQDDELLGLGGSFARGLGKVSFLSVCKREYEGAWPTGRDEAYESALVGAIRSIREVEDQDITFARFLPGSLDVRRVADRILAEIDRMNAEVVFLPSGSDIHQDHRAVNEAGRVATRGLTALEAVLEYEVLSSTEQRNDAAWAPTVFVELHEKDVRRKVDAMSEFFPGEMYPWPHPRSKIGIETLAQYRGMQAGVCYAEAFRLLRGVLFR